MEIRDDLAFEPVLSARSLQGGFLIGSSDGSRSCPSSIFRHGGSVLWYKPLLNQSNSACKHGSALIFTTAEENRLLLMRDLTLEVRRMEARLGCNAQGSDLLILDILPSWRMRFGPGFNFLRPVVWFFLFHRIPQALHSRTFPKGWSNMVRRVRTVRQ